MLICADEGLSTRQTPVPSLYVIQGAVDKLPIMADTKGNDVPVDVFEEGDAPKEAQSIHRIRANSSIMQLNKILGELVWVSLKSRARGDSRLSIAGDTG